MCAFATVENSYKVNWVIIVFSSLIPPRIRYRVHGQMRLGRRIKLPQRRRRINKQAASYAPAPKAPVINPSGEIVLWPLSDVNYIHLQPSRQTTPFNYIKASFSDLCLLGLFERSCRRSTVSADPVPV